LTKLNQRSSNQKKIWIQFFEILNSLIDPFQILMACVCPHTQRKSFGVFSILEVVCCWLGRYWRGSFWSSFWGLVEALLTNSLIGPIHYPKVSVFYPQKKLMTSLGAFFFIEFWKVENILLKYEIYFQPFKLPIQVMLSRSHRWKERVTQRFCIASHFQPKS
jgi:hypothetical protein